MSWSIGWNWGKSSGCIMPSCRKKIKASGSDLLTRIPVSRSLVQGLLYRWTEHLILPMPTGGGFQNLIMQHKLNQSL